MRYLLIALALMLAAAVPAQWLKWNPLESDCAKYARLEAEARCENGEWKERLALHYAADTYNSEEHCMKVIEAKALLICIRDRGKN